MLTCCSAGPSVIASIEEGAATTVVAAAAAEFAHTGGHYLDHGQEAFTVSEDAELADHPHAVKAWALDPTRAQRLWTVSARMLTD